MPILFVVNHGETGYDCLCVIDFCPEKYVGVDKIKVTF